jgi:hypothetical protein
MSSQDRPGVGQTDRRAEHKHTIRREFHSQLQQLWANDKFLRDYTVTPGVQLPQIVPSAAAFGRWGPDQSKQIPLSTYLATQYDEYGYHFVPLVREKEHLSCALRILFLRRDPPGAIYQAGDIDNRIKTLLDALRRPQRREEVPQPPQAGEDPFFVLLEDDKLITHLEVETDTLHMAPTGKPNDAALAQLIITVDVRPHYVTMDNLSYV